MKKFTAILVLAMFLVSLAPISLAQEDADDANTTDVRIGQKRVELRENFSRQKERFQEIKQKYAEKKGRMEELKDKIKKCRQDDGCADEKKELKGNTIEFLKNAADLTIASIEKLKAKVQESEDITEEERQQMLAELDERINALQDAKSTLEGMDENTPAEDVREGKNGLIRGL